MFTSGLIKRKFHASDMSCTAHGYKLIIENESTIIKKWSESRAKSIRTWCKLISKSVSKAVLATSWVFLYSVNKKIHGPQFFKKVSKVVPKIIQNMFKNLPEIYWKRLTNQMRFRMHLGRLLDRFWVNVAAILGARMVPKLNPNRLKILFEKRMQKK